MRKIEWIGISLLLSLVLGSAVFAQETLPPQGDDQVLPIMRPDPETLHKWIEEYELAPREEINPEIHAYLLGAQAAGYGTSLSLLNRIQYTPAERNQGNCGDCWVWASTGLMEIALDVQNGVHDRLSEQFLNSCKTDNFACCGGNLNGFSTWYASKGYAIPWSNTNAFFQDGGRSCAIGSPAVACASISTSPNYPITSISPTTVGTAGVGQATAITNIKAALNSNKGVLFAFFLADNTDWSGFYSFWNGLSETAIWDPDVYCSHTWVNGQGGGHAVVIVGYNDDDPTPANRYWVVLNSWGTASGGRPNGLFRMKMYMNYDCIMHESGYSDWYSRQFQTLNVTYNVSPPVNLYEKMGVFRTGAWYVDRNGNGNWDGCTVEGCLGPFGGYAQDKPVTGDWNGSGATKIGIYRRDPVHNLSYWYLDNGNGQWDGCGTFPTQDLCLGSFGGYAQDIPITGDWNGSGTTKIGIYRRDPVHNLSYWYLDNDNGQWDGCGTFPTQDLCLGSFGGYAQDIPVTGDWNGDGPTKIGIYRRDPIQNLSYWYLDNGNGQWDGCGTFPTQDLCLGSFGGYAQDIPVTGDWNGDGKTKIGIYRRDPITNLSYWYLDNGNGRWDGCGTFPTQDLCLGSFGGYAQDIPVVGKW